MRYPDFYLSKNVLLAVAVLFLFQADTVSAQNEQFAVAVLTDKEAWTDPFFQTIQKKVFDRVLKKNVENLRFYSWDPEKHTVDYSDLNKAGEKPCHTILFLESDFNYSLTPPIDVSRDAKGVVTSVGFKLSPYSRYQVKIIDMATSTLLAKEVIDVHGVKPKVIPISNYSSLFGMAPDVLQKKDASKYNQILMGLHEKFKDQFTTYYRELIENEFLYESKTMRVIFSKPNIVFKVVPEPGRTEEKAKLIQVYGGVKDNLFKDEGFDLYVRREMKGFPYYEDIGTYHIEEVGDSISTAKAWLSANKDVGEALKNGEELVMIRYGDTFTEKMLNHNPKIARVNLAVRNDCRNCDSRINDRLYSSPAINIIERQSPELVYFGKMLKDDRFIDYDLEEYQGKRLGYEILVVPDVKFCQVIEVKSNVNILSLPYKYEVVNNQNVQTLNQSSIHSILEAYDPETYAVQWIETLKEKNGKIEEIAIYHPGGMVRYMDFDIFVKVNETVDGELFERKKPIGKARVGSSISTNISKLNIKDGERELFLAREKGEQVVFSVSEKSMF